MWSAISRVLTRNKSQDSCPSPRHQERNISGDVPVANTVVHVFDRMDRNTEERRKGSGDYLGVGGDSEHITDSYDSRQAKQRASVKWLLSKAYNNRVPDMLREPYYRDHEDQEHLKPQIVHALSNAELYCLALANIYSDPNYHNQNHTGILQALARKGVYISEPHSSSLTETILIQNSPLKMSAHMAVIEGLMALYAKEVVTGDRVVAAIQRFDPLAKVDVPSDHEKGILCWINHASRALIAKIQSEEGSGDKSRLPELPAAKDFQSLCDGVGLAAVVAFYCPGELNWMDIRVSKRPSVADALHNLALVQAFCVRCLPYPIFHMQPEDVTYMRGSMKQNLVVFLAEMYNVLEIHPAKCVRYPGQDISQHYLDVPKTQSSFAVKKSPSLQHAVDSHFNDDRTYCRKTSSEESFASHLSKGTPSSEESAPRAVLRAEAAGRPSNWEERRDRRSSYAGRRSRRNSVTEDSQLTIENFGGSQDNLSVFGKNPDKQVGGHIGKRNPTEPTLPARSHIQDAYGSGIQFILADNGHGNEEIAPRLKRQVSNPNLSNVALKNILHSSENDTPDGETTKMASFANLSRQTSEKGINVTYTEQDRDDTPAKQNVVNKHGQSNGNGLVDKKTSFATLPNTTTTWQQQSTQQTQQPEKQPPADETNSCKVMASELNNIRLKLEEKRRRIESDKLKMEVVMSKQRQKVGKAAFLQAVTKEISEDVRDVEHKWLDLDGGAPYVETRRTPDIENMDLDQYHQSISHMNSSLSEIQADIQRLTNQQNQIQQQHLMSQHQQQMQQQLQQLQSLSQQHMQEEERKRRIFSSETCYLSQSFVVPPANPMPPRLQDPLQSQFYLHDQPQVVQRRTWGQPAPVHSLASEIASVGYQQSMEARYAPQPPVYQQDKYVASMYQDTRTWGVHLPPQKGFVLHDTSQDQRYLNGGDHSLSTNNQLNHPASSYVSPQQHYSQTPPSSASPQHRSAMSKLSSVHRISQMLNESAEHKRPNVHHMQMSGESSAEKRHINALHQSMSSPPGDELERDNVCFLNSNNDDDLNQGIRGLNISSGSRTYRLESPTRPSISRNSFQPQSSLRESTPSPLGTSTEISPMDVNEPAEKGFYISFDDAPKPKPKPSFRAKRSPKKERSASLIDRDDYPMNPESLATTERHRQMESQRDVRERQRQLDERSAFPVKEPRERDVRKEVEKERPRPRPRETSTDGRGASSGIGLVIGNELTNPDPNSVDEMERKKERIMLLSLQRRQQQEELKERKEAEIQARKDQEKMKEEDKARKKAEEKQRRAAILEQYKLKKAIEEAEREGKKLVLDKEVINSIKPTKLRVKGTPGRPRPKTIHVDAGTDYDSGVLTPSRGKKGSSSNLSTVSLSSTPMRRDYYRGSQDSLTAAHLDEHRRSSSLYRGGSLRDSPDDGRGSSPTRSSNLLGRRGSYKTSRDAQEPQQQVRGRPKYTTFQNFKGRKSNSLMNLCDTDSGLGTATPPRRAASPGMGSMRVLPSPSSGPGSLPPGLITKRRIFDDGSSDISSTPSSMMDYSGPRLYKQPATKSNRNIIMNAVEYCVFPGTVNQEAKRRVLDEIQRSESKHFLILFRDGGCQFRALYSFCPDQEVIVKLYGTGPKQVNDRMFDKFFKYNSGGKCFAQIHTKHLTVTIDAFTIHNSLWQGKKVNLPNKKDMSLVI